MGELLTAYYTADRLGAALVILAVVAIFAVVRHDGRIRKRSDG